MAITVFEKHGSPEARFVNPVDGSGSSFGRTYVVFGTVNVGDAVDAVIAASNVTINGPDGEVLVRQEYTPRPTGPDSWEVDVRYASEDDRRSQEPPAAGDWQFSFDTTGGSTKITQSLLTVWRGERDASYPAPDLQGAIGYDGKKVNGVEIVVPKMDFSIRAYYAANAVTTGFLVNLARHTGMTNSVSWLGFAGGEVLYLGSSGEGDIPLLAGQRVKPIPITHKFSASENLTSVQVGDITVPSKKGWEYLWARHEKFEEDNGLGDLDVLAKPVHAYVERVYRETNFASLFGIG